MPARGDPGTGAWWRRKWSPRPRSQTPGKNKGENCQASAQDKYFCKRNRSWKRKDYGAWCRKMDRKRTGSK